MTEQSIRAKTEQRCRKRGASEEGTGLTGIAELDPTALEQAAKLEQQGCAAAWPFLGIPVLVKDNIDVQGPSYHGGQPGAGKSCGGIRCAGDSKFTQKWRGDPRKNQYDGVCKLHHPGYAERVQFPGRSSDSCYESGIEPFRIIQWFSGGGGCGNLFRRPVGTDTSFSILAARRKRRVRPKPPVGALPWAGIIPIAHTLDSAGPLATNMSDTLPAVFCYAG